MHATFYVHKRMANQPEFLYAAFILPALFSLTLILEGLGKIKRQESGMLQLVSGSVFLLIMVNIFIFFLIR